MFYRQRATINKEGFNEYISYYSPKKLDDYIDSLDDEDCIECFTIHLPNSHPCYYDQLWLIDTDECSIPVLIPDINTSSVFAMVYSTLVDNDDDDDDVVEVSLEEVIEMVGNGWKKGLTKVLTEYRDIKQEKIKKEKENRKAENERRTQEREAMKLKRAEERQGALEYILK